MPKKCVFRGVTNVSAARSIGWDVAKGYLRPAVLPHGSRGDVALSAPRMVTQLQGHLPVTGLPSHFMLHSFRSGGCLSKSLARTPKDEPMKIGGWKTGNMARYYVGSTVLLVRG